MRTVVAMLISLTLSTALVAAQADSAKPKTASALYGPALMEKAKANAAKYPWAADITQPVIRNAEKWLGLSDDQLWEMMFGATISRSWMVWSNGFCPACKKGVPMYTWEFDAFERPWKMRCPHCKDLFPKNDFGKFYGSGLDEHHVFNPKRADRSLLFNAQHPDPKDPLHLFGVDDGEGYVEGANRWRFIGAYLIYAQWKQAVLGGIRSLAGAYTVTGDKRYAHKAAVLLDRVADVYPTFSFATQAFVYENPGIAGYVSTWHDACGEANSLAQSYDQVFEGMADDSELVAFLSAKARQYKLDNPKSSTTDIRRNIEDRILRDTLANRKKIESNYPQTDFTLALIKTVLGWPGNRDEVMKILDGVFDTATAVDGLTGEKGLGSYGAWSPKTVALVLMQYARVDPGFLVRAYERHPKLRDSYRFHIDTWCLGNYYPCVGDTGTFGRPNPNYEGVGLTLNPGLQPSGYEFLWEMYKLTGDPAYVQILYRGNGYKLDGLPHSLFAADPEQFQRSVKEVIDREGTEPRVESTNKQQWHLAVLRSGKKPNERCLWLNYEAWGRHGHADCMNLGLMAKGLDLMPDFGYPQVQYGGWNSPKANWYKRTAAHNTVVIHGANQTAGAGRTTLWASGRNVRAVRASASKFTGARQYERTLAMVDTSASDSYVIDVFRVVGGTDHAKFTHSYYGKITPSGLALSPSDEYGHGTIMRSFAADPNPAPGWSVDWRIDDQYQLLPKGKQVRLRYTDLTSGAQAITAEGWVSQGMYNTNEDLWIPMVVTRRTASDGSLLASTFVSTLEPYERRPAIKRVRRFPVRSLAGTEYPDSFVGLEIALAEGRTDIFACADTENPLAAKPAFSGSSSLVSPELGLRLDGEMCLLRLDSNGEVERIALFNSRSVSFGHTCLTLKSQAEFLELTNDRGRWKVLSGDTKNVAELVIDGHSILL